MTSKADPLELVERRARYNLKYRYGISPEDVDALVCAQNGRCPICTAALDRSDPKTKFVIDHDHTTLNVRGILCQRCNLMVGFYEHARSLLPAIQQYLGEDRRE